MVRWPFFESTPARELLEQFLDDRRRAQVRGEPIPVNVHDAGGELVVQAGIPGVAPEDVEIQCGEGVLTIRARRQIAERDYIHQEIHTVETLRQLALPADCKFDEASADAEFGILTIRIPKVRPRAPEKIRIQVNRRPGDGGATTIDAKPI